MRSRHPSRTRLQRWLATGEPRRVDRHVASCERCQSILDELSRLDEAVVADLHEVVTPPDDFDERISEGVDDRLRDEEAAGAFFDLFTIGWDVMRHVLDPDGPDDSAQSDEEAADGSGGGT